MSVHDVLRAAVHERIKQGVPYLKEDEDDLLATVPDRATPPPTRAFTDYVRDIIERFERSRFGPKPVRKG
jgi:hypothetical protein